MVTWPTLKQASVPLRRIDARNSLDALHQRERERAREAERGRETEGESGVHRIAHVHRVTPNARMNPHRIGARWLGAGGGLRGGRGVAAGWQRAVVKCGSECN